jgi:hypothetical protein
MSDNRFDDLFEEANAAFDGKYKDELNTLKRLTPEEIEQITPDTTTSKEAYNALIQEVEKASKENLSQAELIGNIKTLGNTAIHIAKKIPSFEQLL